MKVGTKMIKMYIRLKTNLLLINLIPIMINFHIKAKDKVEVYIIGPLGHQILKMAAVELNNINSEVLQTPVIPTINKTNQVHVFNPQLKTIQNSHIQTMQDYRKIQFHSTMMK